MEIEEIFIGFLVLTCLVLVFVVLPVALFVDSEYGGKYKAECESKGGVVLHPYKSNRICVPKETIIPVEVQ